MIMIVSTDIGIYNLVGPISWCGQTIGLAYSFDVAKLSKNLAP